MIKSGKIIFIYLKIRPFITKYNCQHFFVYNVDKKTTPMTNIL